MPRRKMTARKNSAKKRTKPTRKKSTKKQSKARKVPPPPKPPVNSTNKRNPKRKNPPRSRNIRAKSNKRVKPNPVAEDTELADSGVPRMKSAVSQLRSMVARCSVSKAQATRRRCAAEASSIPIDLDSPSRHQSDGMSRSPSPGAHAEEFATYNEFIQDALRTRETPNELKGRETENKAIVDFIRESVQKRASAKECGGGSLYICGSPGTGKSATIFNIQRSLNRTLEDIDQEFNIVKICAMQCHTPQQIYPMILRGLIPGSKCSDPHQACQQLQRIFLNPKSKKKTILIVDEIDGLLSGQVTVLYRMFEWPKQLGSNLILIGIANSIDLTNRFLPRLQQRKTQPKVMIFRPYTQEQLAAVVEDRLALADREWESSGNDAEESLFHPMAISIITKKVAQMYGDVRKTLEICRACLDSIKNSGAEQVDFALSKTILRQMYGSRFSEVIQSLPNQQLILLVISMILSRTMPSAQRTKISEFYGYMTKKHNLPVVKACEFSDMLSNLLSLGLLCEAKRGARSRRGWAPLKCLLQQEDIEVALGEIPKSGQLVALLKMTHNSIPHSFITKVK